MKVNRQNIDIYYNTLVCGGESLSSGVFKPASLTATDIFLTVVIPAYNEENRLPASLEKIWSFLESQPYTSEIIVVDDGSSDGTIETVNQLVSKCENNLTRCRFRLIENQHRGKGYAVRTGMLAGLGEYILFSDADLSTPIEEISKLLECFEQGVEVAVGSREGHGALRFNEPLHRHIMGRVFNFLVRLVTRSNLKDTQCGFKAFTREVARDLFSHVQIYGEKSTPIKDAMVTGFDVEVLFLASKKGYKIKEVPVRWYRVDGSKVNPVKDSVRMFVDVLKVRLNDLRGLYNF
jgi:dolichyl-phosphate beta-glucosyltransferase